MLSAEHQVSYIPPPPENNSDAVSHFGGIRARETLISQGDEGKQQGFAWKHKREAPSKTVGEQSSLKRQDGDSVEHN